MTPFTLGNIPTGASDETLLAGGTTVLDLMKLGTLAPQRLIDLSTRHTELSTITNGNPRRK